MSTPKEVGQASSLPTSSLGNIGRLEACPTGNEAVIEMIKRLPDEVSVPDIIAELYFRQKVDEGLRQLDAGLGIHTMRRRRSSRNR